MRAAALVALLAFLLALAVADDPHGATDDDAEAEARLWPWLQEPEEGVMRGVAWCRVAPRPPRTEDV
jgi:hypothetical protein